MVSLDPPTAEEWTNHWKKLIRSGEEGSLEENDMFLINNGGVGKRGGKGIGRHAAASVNYYSFLRHPPSSEKKEKDAVPKVEVVSPSEQVVQQAKALPDKEDVDINIRSDESPKASHSKRKRRGGKTVKKKTSDTKNKKKKKK